MIGVDSKLKNLYALEVFKEVKDHIVGGGSDYFCGEKGDLTLHELQERKQPTWNAEDMAYGLNRLREIAVSGREYVFSPYSEEERSQSPDKRGTGVVWFPGGSKRREWIILASGGGYGSVCNLAEGFPVAAKWNEMGYTCFCLTYRTATAESFERGLMPKPFEDLSAAYQWIASRADTFGIDPEKYCLCGFSAGGHLCAGWGTDTLGYRKFGLPAPRKIVLVYPLVDLTAITGQIAQYLFTGLFGKNYAADMPQRYSPLYHIDSAYPPTYLIQAKDDRTVSVEKSRAFVQALQENRVTVEAEFTVSGEHGFGLGSRTPAAGWQERAVRFCAK